MVSTTVSIDDAVDQPSAESDEDENHSTYNVKRTIDYSDVKMQQVLSSFSSLDVDEGIQVPAPSEYIDVANEQNGEASPSSNEINVENDDLPVMQHSERYAEEDVDEDEMASDEN
jgi:hypothetical protein